MASVTLATLRTRARAAADQENSTFVADARLNEWLNSAADELYNLLVSKFEDYYLTSTLISLVAGTDTYALPATFFKARGVDILDSGVYRPIDRFEFNERGRYADTTGAPLTTLRYQLRGSSLVFAPAPTSAGAAKLWYIPTRAQMATDADTLDGVSGWEEYVVTRAAIRCLDKEESDSSALRSDLAAIMRRIDEVAANRDAGRVSRIADVFGVDYNIRGEPWV